MIYPCPMFDAKATIIENAVGSLPNVRCQDCKLLPWAVMYVASRNRLANYYGVSFGTGSAEIYTEPIFP